jgi:hypothetical protein
LSAIEIYSYQKKENWRDDIQFDKTLYFGKDSFLHEIKLNYYPPSSEGSEFFELSLINRWKNVNEESLYIDHYIGDSVKNTSLEIHYEQDGSIELSQLSHVQIEYSSDSVEFTRVLSPSKELVNHYRNIAFMYADSIEITERLPAPDISTCTKLISSHYYFKETLSEENNCYRETFIDSSFIQRELKIDKRTNVYYRSEEKDSTGITVIRYHNAPNSFYSEWHFAESESYPVYKLEISMDTISKDTIYRMEMKASQIGKERLYSYDIFDIRPMTEKPSYDLRIPITNREIKIWTNKFGQIIRFHSIGYTDRGHKLEYAYEGWPEKVKVTIDNRIITEISGEQKYDLETHHTYYNGWLYSNPKSNKRNKKSAIKRPTPSIPFGFKTNSKVVEKNRNENYEKLVSPDSLSFYHVYYYDK